MKNPKKLLRAIARLPRVGLARWSRGVFFVQRNGWKESARCVVFAFRGRLAAPEGVSEALFERLKGDAQKELMWACLEPGRLEEAQRAIDRGADANGAGRFFDLTEAEIKKHVGGHHRVGRYMNWREHRDRFCPLNVALWEQNETMIEFLLARGAKISNLKAGVHTNGSPLEAAILNGSPAATRDVLRQWPHLAQSTRQEQDRHLGLAPGMSMMKLAVCDAFDTRREAAGVIVQSLLSPTAVGDALGGARGVQGVPGAQGVCTARQLSPRWQANEEERSSILKEALSKGQDLAAIALFEAGARPEPGLLDSPQMAQASIDGVKGRIEAMTGLRGHRASGAQIRSLAQSMVEKSELAKWIAGVETAGAGGSQEGASANPRARGERKANRL